MIEMPSRSNTIGNILQKGYIKGQKRRFSPKFKNCIDGWYFSKTKIKEAKKKGKMLMLDFEVGVPCSLNCPFCFRKEDERDGSYSVLSPSESMDIISQAKDLGCESVHIVGQGEPLEDKDIFTILEHIYDNDMVPLLFTAGHILGDDNFASFKHPNMDGYSIIKKLKDLNTSVVIKINSFKERLQNNIVGRPSRKKKMSGTGKKYNYAKYRNEGLLRLLEAGFNKPNPTKLGADVLVLNSNYYEVERIYITCRGLDIYPLIVTFIPCGRTSVKSQREEFDISDEEKIDLWKKIYKYNIEHGIKYDGVSAMAGGHSCKQPLYALYVSVRGQVYSCPGDLYQLGNLVRNGENLSTIWERAPKISGFSCLPRLSSAALPIKLQTEIDAYIKLLKRKEG